VIRLTAVIDLEGQSRALTHESNNRSLIIGRDASADFQVPLTTVSRQHARIGEADGIYTLEDLGSTHGTVLNGKKVVKGEKKMLRDGDIIELTKAKITINIEAKKVVSADPSEGTQAIAARAVQGILGRLGDAEGEGPYLRVISGPEEGTRFRFQGTGTEWALGRSKDCEFVLNDPNVSRKHAIVKKDWNGFVVVDLGSKNGVVVNEKKIQKPRRLKDRDEIVIGPVKLVYIDPDADLMAALSDVPGFAQEEPEEPEPMSGDPSQLGAPQPEGDVPPPPEGDGADVAVAPPPQPQEDEYANIDPTLLETEEKRLPVEWIVIGTVGVVMVLSVLVLLIAL
jgi:pSer/pThr/pTyr-binding forkhead associated (FHA) protein